MQGVFAQLRPDRRFSDEFFAEVRHYLRQIGRPILAWDLETGTNARAARENPWAIPKDKLALHAYSARIYLSGFLEQTFAYHPLFDDESEAALLQQTVERLERAYEEGAILVGHHLLKFDFRMLGRRYSLLTGRKPPVWFQAEWYNARSRRIVDTTQLISQGEFGSAVGTTSLSRLVRLWGRNEVSHGPTFGPEWETGDPLRRRELMEYTRWNLIDSLLLAVFSGVLLPFAPPRTPQPLSLQVTRRAFVPSGYTAPAYPPIAGFPLAPAPFSVAFLLTSPAAGLLANGPEGTGWDGILDQLLQKDLRKAEDKLSGLTKYGLDLNQARAGLRDKAAQATARELQKKQAEFPLKKTGRYRPLHCRVVGYALLAASEAEPEIFLAPDLEALCLIQFVQRLHAAKARGHLYSYSWEAARSLLLYRGSLHGLAWEPWVLGFDGEEIMRDQNFYGRDETMDGLTQYAIERGLIAAGATIEEPPLYYDGAGQDAFLGQVRGYLRVLSAHIADSPALPGVRPLMVEKAA